MNSTDLITFLDRPDGPQQFRRAAAEPLAIFRRAVMTTGYSSAPVEITIQKTRISLKTEHLWRLCKWYIAGDLDGVEIEYVATALALCPDFVPESENVKAAIYGLCELRQADNEKERVQEIYDEVGGEEKRTG